MGVLLETTGAKDSKFMEKATEWAASYGAYGLIFIQLNPLTPVPTAVLVVAGMVAKMNEWTVMGVLAVGKFLTLLLGAVATSYATEGKTVEEVLREQVKGEKPGEEKKETDEKKD